MDLKTWKITSLPGAGFHFGEQGLGQEESSAAMPSDSLFSALVARQAANLGQAGVDALLEGFLSGQPPFVLSSTFPFAGGVRFFPAPARPFGSAGVKVKELKKVRYLSETLFRQVLEGQTLADLLPLAEPLQNKSLLIAKSELSLLPPGFVKTAEEKKLQPDGALRKDAAVWKMEQRPRVALDRFSQASRLYFTGRVSFAQGCGLWLGIRWLDPDPNLQSQVAGLLAELGDAGLGGERSSGFGACQILPDGDLQLPGPGRGLWTNLSRYLPGAAEMPALQHALANYKLQPVGGWLESSHSTGQRRRTLNMLAEGSVLGPLDVDVPGTLADVRPSYPGSPDPLKHAVYRAGLALAVGLS